MEYVLQPSRAFGRTLVGIFLGVASIAALLGASSTDAIAQTWPSKPVTIVSPYSAGGITDALCRIVSEQLAKELGKPVLVENRAGAGGAIAMSMVAKAVPDGHTLVMGGSAPSVIIPALNPSITYDPLRDFEPVGFVAELPTMLVVHPSVPAATLKEFIAYARANPNKLNCASHGIGTGTHLACVQFDRMVGTQMTHVPYKGAPEVNNDLLAGRIEVYFGVLATEIGFVRAGRLRTYGVASLERAAFAADIQTLNEAGLPGFTMSAWNALYAPPGTPAPILTRLNAALMKILNMPEIRKKIEATGSIVRPGSIEQLRKQTTDEFQLYRKLGTEANIRLD
jgi:tripartite-type tricarboxylate transporter receptor subunit TctC